MDIGEVVPPARHASWAKRRSANARVRSLGAMTSYRLAVVGGGNMGAALVGGLLQAGWAAADLAVVEVLAGRADELGSMFPGVAVVAEVPPCQAALVAVKPYDVPAACAAAVAAGATRGSSASPPGVSGDAAGGRLRPRSWWCVRCRTRRRWWARGGGDRRRRHRRAPTTWPGPRRSWARWARSCVVPEPQLDAVTGLAGSGPAYVFLVAEALIDAGVLAGLSRADSEALTTQLLVGSAALLRERGDPARLRAQVTSPGGTTAAGLRVLEEHAVRSAFQEAVMAATRRSVELGQK